MSQKYVDKLARSFQNNAPCFPISYVAMMNSCFFLRQYNIISIIIISIMIMHGLCMVTMK